MENVKKLITDSKGEVGEIEEWGKKTLQFEIAKESSANYYLINFEADQKTLPSLSSKLRMQDDLIRFLIIKKLTPKKLKEKKPTRKDSLKDIGEEKASLAKSESRRAKVAAKEAQIIGR